ncbi:hypothetical protein Tco_0301129 [Tanacetum coccineum]
MRQLEGYKINSTYNNKQRYISYDLDQKYFYSEGNPLVTPWVLTSDGRIDVGNSNYNFLTPEFCYGIETRMGCMKGSGLPECRTENDNLSKQNEEFVTAVTTSVTDRNLSLGITHRIRLVQLQAWELWQQGKILELKDPIVESTCVVQQFSRTIHVALLCVQDSAIERPTTSDMISMLLNDTISLPTPNKPPYAMVRGQSMSTSNGRNSEPKDFSVNNMSITVMDGR